jgi:hypothetical protein
VTRMTLAVALVAALGVAVGSSLAAPAKTAICYQVKNGPYASWKLPAAVAKSAGIPREIKGTTWTGFATGVGCQSQAAARSLLAKYPAARKTLAGYVKPPLKGFSLCSTGNGEVACIGKSRQFTLLESGSYTLAQIKQLAATGKLPLG